MYLSALHISMYRLDHRKCPKTFLYWSTAPSSGQIGHVHQDLVVHQATSFPSVHQAKKMSVRIPLSETKNFGDTFYDPDGTYVYIEGYWNVQMFSAGFAR